MYRARIGDFPLIVHPCKYWWVGLAVACTHETTKYDEKWEQIHDKLKEQFNFTGYGLRPVKIGSGEKEIIVREFFVILDDNSRETVKDPELLIILNKYENGRPKWNACPYEKGDQSKCPFYVPELSYLAIPLEELRQRKGHEI